MEYLPDQQAALAEINKDYKNLNRSFPTFNYLSFYPERQEQIVLISNSFAHLPLKASEPISRPAELRRTITTSHYNEYGNLFYPLERPLIENLVKTAVDDEKDIYVFSWGNC